MTVKSVRYFHLHRPLQELALWSLKITEAVETVGVLVAAEVGVGAEIGLGVGRPVLLAHQRSLLQHLLLLQLEGELLLMLLLLLKHPLGFQLLDLLLLLHLQFDQESLQLASLLLSLLQFAKLNT